MGPVGVSDLDILSLLQGERDTTAVPAEGLRINARRLDELFPPRSQGHPVTSCPGGAGPPKIPADRPHPILLDESEELVVRRLLAEYEAGRTRILPGSIERPRKANERVGLLQCGELVAPGLTETRRGSLLDGAPIRGFILEPEERPSAEDPRLEHHAPGPWER